jgi:hypothetical protein
MSRALDLDAQRLVFTPHAPGAKPMAVPPLDVVVRILKTAGIIDVHIDPETPPAQTSQLWWKTATPATGSGHMRYWNGSAWVAVVPGPGVGYVRRDGTTPFTVPQPGIDAVAANHLVTLQQLTAVAAQTGGGQTWGAWSEAPANPVRGHRHWLVPGDTLYVAVNDSVGDVWVDVSTAGVDADSLIATLTEPTTPFLGEEWHGPFGVRKWSTDGSSYFWAQLGTY